QGRPERKLGERPPEIDVAGQLPPGRGSGLSFGTRGKTLSEGPRCHEAQRPTQ
ncbi:unnamed protein product, partial [Scytosiphon promiscuus]